MEVLAEEEASAAQMHSKQQPIEQN